MQPKRNDIFLGLLSAVLAHVLWGVFPLFWRLLESVDPFVVVCHRVLWSFVFLALGAPWLYRSLDPVSRSSVVGSLKRRKIWLAFSVAGILIATNWLTFIWAVNHERVLEASLGYYINPLLNVVLGVLVIGERLSPRQWTAVSIAAAGVVVITIASGGLPWPSLVLAVTFSIYALVKKKAPLPALLGLLLETGILLVPACFFLGYIQSTQGGIIGDGHAQIVLLLIFGGAVTIMPLALFAFSARRIPLSTIGILQYIGPTLHFLIGTLVLHEAFDRWRLLGFVLVWIALAVFLTSRPRATPQADRKDPAPAPRQEALDEAV